MEAVVDDLRQYVTSFNQSYPEVAAIGVGFPAVVDQNRSLVHIPPNMPGWRPIDLQATLQSCSAVPVVIDNDANVAAIAELYAGSGKGLQNFLYVTLGTGVGGAIVSESSLFHGESGGAGEIGHVIISENEDQLQYVSGPDERPFRRAVLERYTGREAIIQRARYLAQQYPQSLLHAYGPAIDVEHISRAAFENDEAALLCFAQIGRLLAIGIASALNLLDMHVVIIGGGISKAHPFLMQSVESELRERVLPSLASKVELRIAAFEEQAGVIGAAMLAMSQHSPE